MNTRSTSTKLSLALAPVRLAGMALSASSNAVVSVADVAVNCYGQAVRVITNAVG